MMSTVSSNNLFCISCSVCFGNILVTGLPRMIITARMGHDHHSSILGGCTFNGRRPLSGMKYPTRESPHRDAASPIKYNGLRVRRPL